MKMTKHDADGHRLSRLEEEQMVVNLYRDELIDLILACKVFYDAKSGTRWRDIGNKLREQLELYDNEMKVRKENEQK